MEYADGGNLDSIKFKIGDLSNIIKQHIKDKKIIEEEKVFKIKMK
jgi:hypothetical protein